jgi:hypothetical protein
MNGSGRTDRSQVTHSCHIRRDRTILAGTVRWDGKRYGLIWVFCKSEYFENQNIFVLGWPRGGARAVRGSAKTKISKTTPCKVRI